jgi:hypothetical protein
MKTSMFGISREGFSDKSDRLFNSIGLKSLGKVFMTGIAPTVPNRIFHATGTRIREILIGIEHLLRSSNGTAAAVPPVSYRHDSFWPMPGPAPRRRPGQADVRGSDHLRRRASHASKGKTGSYRRCGFSSSPCIGDRHKFCGSWVLAPAVSRLKSGRATVAV